jgi:ATP-dependent Lon protease
MPDNFKRNLSDAENGESPEINIPEELPLLAVRDIVVFPNMILPLFVGRESSILAIEAALAQDRLIFLVTQRDPEIDDPQPSDIYDIGTVCLIMRMLKLPDGRLKILVQGLSKAKVLNFQQEKPFLKVIHEVIAEHPQEELSIEAEALMRNAREMTEKILSLKAFSLRR